MFARCVRTDGFIDPCIPTRAAKPPVVRFARAMEPNTGRLFTVAADFTQPAPGQDGKPLPAVYHDNSYTVLTYAPR